MKREVYWQHRLKVFLPNGLNDCEESCLSYVGKTFVLLMQFRLLILLPFLLSASLMLLFYCHYYHHYYFLLLSMIFNLIFYC